VLAMAPDPILSPYQDLQSLANLAYLDLSVVRREEELTADVSHESSPVTGFLYIWVKR
jgi:hypothetical protein